ncbi:uncharacterized protein LOC134233241 [Saccostrea cucullata]|uniref:uncharacterized protein LOC134233241 n=1 Tax=Saccostrea cuccullata TaxID=36930 RepID=UPI002ED0A3A8
MLDKLHQRCKRWRVLFNTDKSKCVHFRKVRRKQTKFEFVIGKKRLEKVDQYKYLGVTFTFSGNFTENAEILSKAGGRALGKIISKIHTNKDFGIKANEKLYYSCVVPFLDYASGVWGYSKYQAVENIQNQAIRYFLGVHRFAPRLALYGDIGWIPSYYQRWMNMIRYWNRILTMDTDRITRLAFDMDYRFCSNNWCSEIKDIFQKLELEHVFNSQVPVDMKTAELCILRYYSSLWEDAVQNVPKLRTYVTIKSTFEQEEYVKLNLSKTERSHLAQLRCGILPLRVETRRYIGERPKERVCQFCDAGHPYENV